MIDLPPSCRHATKDDAIAMAELVNMAGEGLPSYLWSKMALPGQSPWEVGQERARRDTGAFSYRNTIVRRDGSAIAACLIGYPLEHTAVPPDYSQMPPMFVPLQQLEDLAPDSWYVNVLATYPQYRRKGYGSELMNLAERIARELGKRRMSIIVANANVEARSLYRQQGYREHASRQMLKENWISPADNWILLIKEL